MDAIWHMILVRFRPIVQGETHILTARPTITYEDIACDPTLVGNAGMQKLRMDELFKGRNGGSSSQINVAHSQYYREHPNFVHSNFTKVEGFPFITTEPDATRPWNISGTFYDKLFQTTQLRHWQVLAACQDSVMRNIPSARTSFMLSE